MKRRAPLLVALWLAAVVSSAQAGLVDYNSPGDLAANFSINHNGAANRYLEAPSGGLNGTRAVDIAQTIDAEHATAVYNQRSFRLSLPGDRIRVSQFILRRDALISVTPFMMMGVLSDSTERMDQGGDNTSSYASLRIMPSSTNTATDIFLQTETKVNGGSRVRTTPGITGSLVAGHWYLLEAVFEYSSTSDLLVSASLEDWGTVGNALQSTVLTMTPTLIALSGVDQVNGDATVWSGYRGFREGGSDLFDNFSAVPEPATIALILAGALAGIRRRR